MPSSLPCSGYIIHCVISPANSNFGYYLPNLKLTPMYNTHSYASTAYIRQAISKQHVIITQYIIKTYGGALASP